jgi:DNA polymerase III delta subunit
LLEASARAVERLSRPPLPPLVVITGDEPFLQEPLIAAASRAVEEVESFSARPGEGDAAACARLMGAWTTATLIGGPRLIVARQADALFARGRLARLEERLESGEPPHRLLLTLGSLDGRTKLARRLTQLEALFALPPLRDAPPPWQATRAHEPTELEQWILARARERSLALQPAAAAELARRLGNDPARLDGVLAQLAVILKAGAPITAAEIAAHVRPSGAQQLAGFEERLRTGAAGPALELLDRMLAEGVYDHDGRLVAGDPAVDLVLRGSSATTRASSRPTSVSRRRCARRSSAARGSAAPRRARASRPSWGPAAGACSSSATCARSRCRRRAPPSSSRWAGCGACATARASRRTPSCCAWPAP